VKECYHIRRDHYSCGGQVEYEALAVTFSSFASARAAAERLQRDADEEAPPVTFSVIEGGTGVQLWRAGLLDANQPSGLDALLIQGIA
jgi:hypothetical protein